MRGRLKGRRDADNPWLLVVAATVVNPGRAPDEGVLKLVTAAPLRLAGGRAWDDVVSTSYAERQLAVPGSRLDGLGPNEVLAVQARIEDLRIDPAYGKSAT